MPKKGNHLKHEKVEACIFRQSHENTKSGRTSRRLLENRLLQADIVTENFPDMHLPSPSNGYAKPLILCIKILHNWKTWRGFCFPD